MDDYHQLIADRVVEESKRLDRKIDYIEVGVLTGNSAQAVLDTGKCRHATLVDNFSNTYCGEWKSSPELVENRLEIYAIAGIIKIIQGDSRNVLPTINREFDIGFVDGDHSESVCWSDMFNMLPLLRPDGIMFVDDLGKTGSNLLETVERFAFEKSLKMKFHKVHNGLGELTR